MSLLGNIWVKLGLKSDDFQRGMDSAEKKSSRFGNLMKGVAAKVLSVAAALKILGSTFKTITNFEAATSKLAAVLGTTVDKMGRMTDSAIELGRKTQYTATQVTELQTELAKLGFAEPEILSMQEAVLKFAAAVGTDLGSAAARAGATMRGFGLTAEQTKDMLNVMAVSTSKSALSFSYLDSTLGKLVPVAKSFGLDTEGTVALLGTLANAGIDASSAGTALRAIFIKLADSSSKLNKEMGGQPKTLRDKGLELGGASDMVNDRFAAMLLTLANGADDVAALYGELGNANGALDEMYKTMTHNVKGAVEEVKSAWEGFVLSLRGSTGILYTVLTNVRDLIGEVNYALFQSAKESTHTSEYYDKFSRTIEQTKDKVYALDKAYERESKELKQTVKDYEDRKALLEDLSKQGVNTLGAFDNKGYKEAKAQLVGLENAYKQLREELTRKSSGTTVIEDTIKNTQEDTNSLDELLKGLQKKTEYQEGTVGWLREEIKAKEELRDAATDETEIRKLNTEIALLEKKVQELQKIEQLSELPALKAPVGKAEGGSNPLGIDTSGLKHTSEEVDEFIKRLKKQQSDAEDISRGFADALRNGMIDALDELAEAIGTGDLDTTALVRALVTPLADMAISAGTLILSTGEGIEAIKSAFESLNGYAAIAAGVALVGLGVALKAGMAALAKNGASSSAGGGNPYTYTGGYGVTPDMLSSAGPMEIEGTVTVKGQDIQIALDNYNANKRR